MTRPADESAIGTLLNRLKESGEGAFNALSEQLLENQLFLDAMRRTLEAKGRVDRTLAGALDLANIVSKSDVQKIVDAVDDLGVKVARQQRTLAAVEQHLALVKALVEKIAADLARGSAEREP